MEEFLGPPLECTGSGDGGIPRSAPGVYWGVGMEEFLGPPLECTGSGDGGIPRSAPGVYWEWGWRNS